MTIETPTWGWWAKSASTENGRTDLHGNYDGFNFSLSRNTTVHGHGDMVMVDTNDNGTIQATQHASGTWNGDRFRTPDGVNREIYEIAIYDRSTYTYTDADGLTQTYITRAVVYQLGNGDLVVRIRDDDRNHAPTDFFIANVTNIQLGTWDEANYASSIVANFDEPPPNICFASGTLIQTDRGPVAVEDLGIGDLVHTRDNGLQPIRWIGGKRLSGARIRAFPQLRPIRIKAGSLGNGTPTADLVVSPQHRILVRSEIAQRLFGTHEVLVAAKQLLLLEGIEIAEDVTGVEYYHFLFDTHQVVLSNGAETESLYTGRLALKSVSPQARAEIFAIFPELQERDHAPSAARTLIGGRQARKLIMRHARNDKPLVAAS